MSGTFRLDRSNVAREIGFGRKGLDAVIQRGCWTAFILLCICLSSLNGRVPVFGGELAFRHFVIDTELVGRNFGQTAVADLTGDGRPEFVLGNWDGVLQAYQCESPAQWKRFVIGKASKNDVGLASFDVDQDGWVDLVSGGVWYRNPGRLTETFGEVVFDPNISNVHDIAIADMDGDEKPDIVMMSDRHNLRWYRIPEDCRQPWPKFDIGPAVHAGLAVGDLDHDGDTDVVRTDVWFENLNGKGTQWGQRKIGPNTPPPPDFQPKFAFNATKAAVVDLNKDGWNDIVFTDAEIPGGKVWWMENQDGKGTAWRRHEVFNPRKGEPRRGAFHSLAVQDFNGDGHLDIFTAEMEAVRGESNPRWYIWIQLDGQGLQWQEHVILDANLGGHEAKVADFTGDGKLDIISKPWNAHPKNALGGKPFVVFLENISR